MASHPLSMTAAHEHAQSEVASSGQQVMLAWGQSSQGLAHRGLQLQQALNACVKWKMFRRRTRRSGG